MGERREEIRRDPYGPGRTDPVSPAGHPGFDPGTDAFEPEAVNPHPGDQRDETETDEVEKSRAEIARTRADMRETVDAIQERVSPRNIKERAVEQAKGKAQNTGSSLREAVRQNPVPAVLTGIGLGWLLMNARKQSSGPPSYQAQGYPYGYRPPQYEEEGGSSAGQALGRAQSQVGETASQARDRASQLGDQAQDRASQLGSQAQDQAQRAKGGFQRMLQENPLAVGALAVAAGAAVGLAVPESGKEHELMGETRDRAVGRAQDKAEETQEKVQRVAEEARSAAKEEAQNQDLT